MEGHKSLFMIDVATTIVLIQRICRKVNERRGASHILTQSNDDETLEAELIAGLKSKIGTKDSPNMVEDHAPANDNKKLVTKERYAEHTLQVWFPPRWPSEAAYTEDDMQGISRALRRVGKDSLSQVPGLYTVLCLMDYLPDIEQLIIAVVTDLWFLSDIEDQR
jgi:hypothetical protein